MKKGMKINILEKFDLSRGNSPPSTQELKRLKKEKPLQAAVYLAKAGKDKEARQLAEETQQQMHKELDEALQAKYETELKRLNAQLETLHKQRELDAQQISALRKALIPLTHPPFKPTVCPFFDPYCVS